MNIAEKFEIITDKVYEKGVEDMRLAVTNYITDNNTRINYHNAFQYSNFTGFEFAYTIKPTGYVSNLFYTCTKMVEPPKPIDLSEIFSNGNDTATYRKSAFAYCYALEKVPDLNMRAINGIEEWFRQCGALHTIELLRVHENTIYTNTFYECRALENIAFDGVIGQDISFKESPLLTDASLQNIAEHLKDFNAVGSGSATITLHATVKNRIEGTPIYSAITGKGWTIV